MIGLGTQEIVLLALLALPMIGILIYVVVSRQNRATPTRRDDEPRRSE